MERYYLIYKDNVCIASARARLINDEIECREVTKEQYEEYQAEQDEKNEIIKQINELKNNLASWDYKGQKYLDGEYTNEEWEEIKTQRKKWRQQINELENLIK